MDTLDRPDLFLDNDPVGKIKLSVIRRRLARGGTLGVKVPVKTVLFFRKNRNVSVIFFTYFQELLHAGVGVSSGSSAALLVLSNEAEHIINGMLCNIPVHMPVHLDCIKIPGNYCENIREERISMHHVS